VVPMAPETVVLPAPPIVRFCAAPEMLPERVSAPASELMREAEPRVSAPA
jgi:hypothetical protein